MRLNKKIIDIRTAQMLTEKKTKERISKQIATRQNSDEFYSTLMGSSLPNPDPVLKALGKDIDTYEDLKYDSRVSAVIKSRKSAVKKLIWDIKGDDTPDEEKEFYRDIFNNWNMGDIISEILDYFWYGYKPMEIVWNITTDKWYPAALIGKPPRWFTYDEQNNLRFYSKENPTDGILVPKNQFIVARHEATYENPFGEPVASSCFWPVTFRKKGIEYWYILVEKFGIPWVKTTYKKGVKEDEVLAVCNLIEQLIQDAVVATPEDYETELIIGNKDQGKGDSLHKTFLDFQNTEIAMSVLGTNLTTEVQGGSFAAAQSHMDVREEIVDADSAKVEEVFDHLIKLTHFYNFTSKPPKFVLEPEEEIDKTRAERDEKILNSNPNFKFTKKYYQDKYNLDENDFEIVESNNNKTGEEYDGISRTD